jgi:hypothetical protein
MLTPDIRPTFLKGVCKGAWAQASRVRRVDLEQFVQDQAELTSEHCGPACPLVTYRDLHRLLAIIPTLPGGLTMTTSASDADHERSVGQAVAGRLVTNDRPNGVSVCRPKYHGGPRSSVSAHAIQPYLVPTAYQGRHDQPLPRSCVTQPRSESIMRRTGPSQAPCRSCTDCGSRLRAASWICRYSGGGP